MPGIALNVFDPFDDTSLLEERDTGCILSTSCDLAWHNVDIPRGATVVGLTGSIYDDSEVPLAALSLNAADQTPTAAGAAPASARPTGT